MSAANATVTVDSQFQAALRHQTGGRLAEAEAGYCQVLNRDPKHVGARHNLGMVMLDRGQAGAALAHMDYAIELAPDLAEVRNTIANALRQLGRTADAEAAYRKAVALNSGYAAAWYNLATLLHGQGKSDEAETGYRRAIDANPRHRDAHINLSNLLRESRPEEAVRLVQSTGDLPEVRDRLRRRQRAVLENELFELLHPLLGAVEDEEPRGPALAHQRVQRDRGVGQPCREPVLGLVVHVLPRVVASDGVVEGEEIPDGRLLGEVERRGRPRGRVGADRHRLRARRS